VSERTLCEAGGAAALCRRVRDRSPRAAAKVNSHRDVSPFRRFIVVETGTNRAFGTNLEKILLDRME
jgi:hypothetical protein